jgi:hypothetical protein
MAMDAAHSASDGCYRSRDRKKYLRDIADPRCFEVRSVDAHIADAPFANFNVKFGEAANA